MKNLLFLATGLAVSTSVFAQGPSAKSAPTTPYYLGIGIGVSDFGVTQANATYTEHDERDTSSKIFAGYQLNRQFAVEVGYHNLGKYKAALSGGEETASNTNKGTAWVVAAKLTPMSEEKISPFFKLGASHLTNKESGLLNGAAYSLKKSKTNAYYAIGVDYEISKTLGFSLAYESFGKAGDNNDNNQPIRIKPTALSLSFTTRF